MIHASIKYILYIENTLKTFCHFKLTNLNVTPTVC